VKTYSGDVLKRGPAWQACKTMNFVELFFEDKRLTCALMMAWLCIVLFVYSLAGVSDHQGQFLHVGPSKKTIVMGVVIDTWGKWATLASMNFLKTTLNEFVGASLNPWIINTIQDEKTTTLPYTKATCFLVVQLYTIYQHIMSVFGIALLLSQVDFLVFRILADLMVTMFAMYRFMYNKRVQGYNELGAEMAATAKEGEDM